MAHDLFVVTEEELEATEKEALADDDPIVLKPPFPNESDDSSAHILVKVQDCDPLPFPRSRHTTAGRTRGGSICCYQTHGSDLRLPLLSSLTDRASTEDLPCITVQSGRFGSARLDGVHYTRTHGESGASKTLMETKPA